MTERGTTCAACLPGVEASQRSGRSVLAFGLVLAGLVAVGVAVGLFAYFVLG
jgi:hypothetical protein